MGGCTPDWETSQCRETRNASLQPLGSTNANCNPPGDPEWKCVGRYYPSTCLCNKEPSKWNQATCVQEGCEICFCRLGTGRALLYSPPPWTGSGSDGLSIPCRRTDNAKTSPFFSQTRPAPGQQSCNAAARIWRYWTRACEEKRQFPLPAEKSLCHFWNVQVQLKTSGLSSWRKETLKRFPCSHLHPPPSVIKHQSHKCLGKAFPKLPRRLLFCKRVNASQMQTTLDWISELVCSAFTCMLEVAKFWYIPLD